MEELSITEIQNIALEILIYIDEICEKNNIRYFLAYGSLLGAIRHKGFIPWDDDIDIWVPAKDYFNLLDILIGSKRYVLLNGKKSTSMPWAFSKFFDPATIVVDNTEDKRSTNVDRGVSVDIFPLFSCRDDKLFFYRVKYYQHMIGLFFGKGKLGIMQFYRTKLNKLVMNDKQKKYVGCPITPYWRNDIYPYSVFQNSVKMKFENHYFNVPKEYDQILRKLYGDYMRLPPIEKRNSGHDVLVYYRRDYI